MAKAQSGASGAAPDELSLWESEWINCAKRLNCWDGNKQMTQITQIAQITQINK
jgi:hypothetical protein